MLNSLAPFLALFVSALRTAHIARALSQVDSLTLRSRAANVTRSPHTHTQVHSVHVVNSECNVANFDVRFLGILFLKQTNVYYFVLFC